MSRWALLKTALTGDASNEKNLSIHRFKGHSTLEKKKFIWSGYEITHVIKDSNFINLEYIVDLLQDSFKRCDCAEIRICFITEDISPLINILSRWNNAELNIEYSTIPHENKLVIRAKSSQYEPIFRHVQYYSYSLPFPDKNIFTRENSPKTKKFSPQEIFSHQIFNVDNTGNVCVWFSEPIFLKLLLSDEKLRGKIEGKSVLELGGGMTGLIGLGLAAAGISSNICITDGHPHCYANQNSCIEMCKTKGVIPENCKIISELLEWSNPSSSILESSWDIILGADMLFFKEFHDALIILLNKLLKPGSLVLFFQPKRSNSLTIFVEKCQLSGLTVEIQEDYNIELTIEKKNFENNFPEYDPDIHFPLLLQIYK